MTFEYDDVAADVDSNILMIYRPIEFAYSPDDTVCPSLDIWMLEKGIEKTVILFLSLSISPLL